MNEILLTARKYSDSLIQLTRLIPVLSSSTVSIILAIGLAYHDLHGWKDLNGMIMTICILCACILQGIVTHSFNDRTDWKSGTDKESAGILSGGSRVIIQDKLTYQQLLGIGLLGIIVTIGLALYLSINYSRWTILFLAIGLWSSLSYSCKPFQFAYKPFIGEWVSMFPALVTCSAGTFYLLTGTITQDAWMCSNIQSILCVAWVMQHHLADIPADQNASPPKITTPVWVTRHWSITYSKFVPAGCFVLSSFVSLFAIWFLSWVYVISLFVSVFCIILSIRTNPLHVVSITVNEKRMILLTSIHAIALSILYNVIG